MDLSFPDTPDIQVIIKFTSNSQNVGLWTSAQGPSSGHRVFRVKTILELKDFLARVRGLHILDVSKSAFSGLPELWTFLPSLPSVSPKIKYRVFVPSRDFRDTLPPWLPFGVVEKVLPSLDQAYPPQKKVYPPIEQTFSSLWFDPSKVKILIIGQDPYHGPGQAHGLAFSYRGTGPLPPSLKNIFNELTRVDPGFRPQGGDLTPWFRQGVAMINKTFSVVQGQANSLEGVWDKFSEKVFRELAKKVSKDLVVMSWGSKAHLVSSYFSGAKILKSSHPSPMSVNNPPTPFAGNNHFRLANDHLASRGIVPVVWRL